MKSEKRGPDLNVINLSKEREAREFERKRTEMGKIASMRRTMRNMYSGLPFKPTQHEGFLAEAIMSTSSYEVAERWTRLVLDAAGITEQEWNQFATESVDEKGWPDPKAIERLNREV